MKQKEGDLLEKWKCPKCETVNREESCIVCGQPKEVHLEASNQQPEMTSQQFGNTWQQPEMDGRKTFVEGQTSLVKGQQLQSIQPPPDVVAQQPQKRKWVLPVAIGGIAMAVLFIVGGNLFGDNGSMPEVPPAEVGAETDRGVEEVPEIEETTETEVLPETEESTNDENIQDDGAEADDRALEMNPFNLDVWGVQNSIQLESNGVTLDIPLSGSYWIGEVESVYRAVIRDPLANEQRFAVIVQMRTLPRQGYFWQYAVGQRESFLRTIATSGSQMVVDYGSYELEESFLIYVEWECEEGELNTSYLRLDNREGFVIYTELILLNSFEGRLEFFDAYGFMDFVAAGAIQ